MACFDHPCSGRAFLWYHRGFAGSVAEWIERARRRRAAPMATERSR
jgi:hypothetical protein